MTQPYAITLGEEITLAEAREIAQRLINLYNLIIRAPPNDAKTSSSPEVVDEATP
jgi:hypothetical protein